MELNKAEYPLVSIIVITYNSSKYILETLKSAKAQTYQNIELIISDDCSTDNTVEICQNWIEENKKRFVRTNLITVDRNTGVSANGNRGVKAVKSEWVKLIAGDDVLLNVCIDKNIYFAKSNLRANIIVSDLLKINNNSDEIGKTFQKGKYYQYNAAGQYKELLKGNYVYTPSVFYKKSILKYPHYNEKYKMIEDYPFFLRVTKEGNKIFYMKEFTVAKRTHEESIMMKQSLKYQDEISKAYEDSSVLLYKDIIAKEQLKHRMILFYISSMLYIYLNDLKKISPVRFKYLRFLKYLDLLLYSAILKRIVGKLHRLLFGKNLKQI